MHVYFARIFKFVVNVSLVVQDPCLDVMLWFGKELILRKVIKAVMGMWW